MRVFCLTSALILASSASFGTTIEPIDQMRCNLGTICAELSPEEASDVFELGLQGAPIVLTSAAMRTVPSTRLPASDDWKTFFPDTQQQGVVRVTSQASVGGALSCCRSCRVRCIDGHRVRGVPGAARGPDPDHDPDEPTWPIVPPPDGGTGFVDSFGVARSLPGGESGTAKCPEGCEPRSCSVGRRKYRAAFLEGEARRFPGHRAATECGILRSAGLYR